MKEFLVNENDAGQRLDKFVWKVTVSLPKSLLYKAIRTKKIKVNRKRGEIGQILSAGDTVQLFLPPEFFGEKENAWKSLTPCLSVVYEDNNLLIADKPEGVSCHADEVQKTGTLIDHIKAYLYEKGEFCPEEENSFSPALANRIDRNTTGLVICAKNAVALREASELIRSRRVQKKYLAIVHGTFSEPHGVLTHYLLKKEDENRVEVYSAPHPGALSAVTEYRVRQSDPRRDLSLLEITLHTGRTHQIRAQFAAAGHPLLGDSKYGKEREKSAFSHQALRAVSLEFFPREGEVLFYLAGKTFSAPPDERFSHFGEKAGENPR